MTEMIGDMLYPSNATMRQQANDKQTALITSYAALSDDVVRYNNLIKDVYAIALGNMTLVGLVAVGKKPAEPFRAYVDTAVTLPEPPPWTVPVGYIQGLLGISTTVLPAGIAAARYFVVLRQLYAEKTKLTDQYIELRDKLQRSNYEDVASEDSVDSAASEAEADAEMDDVIAVQRAVNLVGANNGNAAAREALANDIALLRYRGTQELRGIQQGAEAIGSESRAEVEAAVAEAKTEMEAVETAFKAEGAAIRTAIGWSVLGVVLIFAVDLIISAISAHQTNEALIDLLATIESRQDGVTKASDDLKDRIALLETVRDGVLLRLQLICNKIQSLHASLGKITLDKEDLASVKTVQEFVTVLVSDDITRLSLLRTAMENPEYAKNPATGNKRLAPQFGGPEALEALLALKKAYDTIGGESFTDPYSLGSNSA